MQEQEQDLSDYEIWRITSEAYLTLHHNHCPAEILALDVMILITHYVRPDLVDEMMKELVEHWGMLPDKYNRPPDSSPPSTHRPPRRPGSKFN